MHRRVLLPALAFALTAVPAFAADPPKKGDTAFEPGKVWQFHLTLTKAEYDAMQPPAGGPGFGGFGPPPRPEPKSGEEKREVHTNQFGVDLPWAKGAVEVDGHTYENVGIRYKGNGTMLDAARATKKSFKVDLDHFGGEQKFRGLKALNLHCGITDPSKCRETLAYESFRAAGVPAPKTAFAEVTLTVPGKFDKEPLGLYTLVQPVDKAFLREQFKTDKGLLMKPEKVGGLNYLGDDWDKYKTTYDPKRDATKEEQARVIAFTRLVNQADDAAFRKEIGDYLDVDAFLKFMAVHAGIASMDSFFTLGHNYYLYLHPDTHKFHFVPWDTDRTFANFPVFGTAAQQLDLSVTKPYAACRLADRLMAMKDVGERYPTILKEVVAAAFTKEKLGGRVKAVQEEAAPLVAKDAAAAKARKEAASNTGFGVPPELAAFVDKRTASIAAQLEGKSKGFTPQAFGGPGGGFGGPGGGFGGPPGGGFGPGNQLSGPLVAKLDANKDGQVSEEEFAAGMKTLFAEWDKDKSGSLDAKKIADGLQKLLPQPGGPGGGFSPPPGR